MNKIYLKNEKEKDFKKQISTLENKMKKKFRKFKELKNLFTLLEKEIFELKIKSSKEIIKNSGI